MPTLAELRAQKGPAPLPRATRTVTLIEGQHLLAESEALEEERIGLLVQAERDAEAAEDDGRKRTQKAGQKPEPTKPARVVEIEARQKEIVGELAGYQSVIGLRGFSGGDWQRYKDEHPPREDNAADVRLTGSLCNASDLFADLGRFVVSWEGDDLVDGEWNSWLAERITYADRRDLVRAVVELHEARLPRSPKSPSSSSSTESSETA
jgi:hypothetical protein